MDLFGYARYLLLFGWFDSISDRFAGCEARVVARKDGGEARVIARVYVSGNERAWEQWPASHFVSSFFYAFAFYPVIGTYIRV